MSIIIHHIFSLSFFSLFCLFQKAVAIARVSIGGATLRNFDKRLPMLKHVH
ncbi:hypothetical protein R6Q59_002960 [Mikania micrantha]